jgi:DNA-binding MurR/RpiR family transcriptional regulator
MDRDIIARLEEGKRSFSKGQLRIARYITDNGDKAAFMTASRLGEKTGVSESTVVRFALALGYSGYPEMRRALQEMIRSRLTSVQRMEVAKTVIGARDPLTAILDADMENILLTQNAADRPTFDRAVEMILNARRIYLLGTRTSAALAMFMGYYFGLLMEDVRVLSENRVEESIEQMLSIGPEDIFIGISYPRYSRRTVKAVRFARGRGAKVLALTDSSASPIARMADICLLARSDMVSFVDSLVAPLSLVNALIAAVCERKPGVEGTLAELEQVWNEYDVYEKSED